MNDYHNFSKSVVSYADTLLELELKEENRKLNEDEMVSLCSEFLNGGTDTTATALQWIMGNLVKYPDVQRKLVEEIREVIGGGDGIGLKKEVKEEDLQKLPYLKCVVLEGLRRHPPGHFALPHVVKEDVVLNGYLVPKDLEGFSKDIEVLISELTPAIERCWNLHHQISRKLTISSAECFVFSKCLTSVSPKFHKFEDDDQVSSPAKSSDLFSLHWRMGVQGLSELITVLQESSCWEVSCMMLDCLLGIPYSFSLDNVVGIICSSIKKVACSAPKISWRLLSNKWLSYLTARGIYNNRESEVPLTDLFCTFLGHAEPEQRIIAVKHLGRLIGQCMNDERASINFRICTDFVPNKLVLSVPDYVLSQLVSNTWDEVVVLASSDTSLKIRVHATILLSNYIPFAERHHLQSFLIAADSICCLRSAQPSHDGSLRQLSLAVIAYACLCAPPEDISLIPQTVWENIETLASTKYDGNLGDLEKRTCQILCRLRNGDEDKEALKEVLSSNSSKQHDPDFAITRESVLQEKCIWHTLDDELFETNFRKRAARLSDMLRRTKLGYEERGIGLP